MPILKAQLEQEWFYNKRYDDVVIFDEWQCKYAYSLNGEDFEVTSGSKSIQPNGGWYLYGHNTARCILIYLGLNH